MVVVISIPFTLNSSFRPHVRVKASLNCINNSIGRQSQTQTEINRILHYTKLLIELFAQILGAWQVNPGHSGWMKAAKQHRHIEYKGERGVFL